ncbi:hypothetical protein YDYSG_08290 [Paenibacillus tyrfis]|nr:hypothetical protein YDYSG_08290 [Paenibacillus tyrfis]
MFKTDKIITKTILKTGVRCSMLKKRILGVTMVAILALSTGQAMAAKEDATRGSVDLTNADVTPFAVSPVTMETTENVGGGTWDYGTKSEWQGWLVWKKRVWSNYNHPTKAHASTASIGTQTNFSGYTLSGTTSYASALGDLSAQTHAYWQTYD